MNLFHRIYATFVAGLVVAVIGASILTFALTGHPRTGIFESKLRGIVRYLGSGSAMRLPDMMRKEDAPRLQRTLDQMRDELGMRASLYDPGGRLVGSAGEPIKPPHASAHEVLRQGEVVVVHRPPPITAFTPLMRDGRLEGYLGLTPEVTARPAELIRPVVWLAGLLGGLALLTYPVARGMAHRLERLTEGAQRIATGDLATRIDARGSDEIGRLGLAMNEMAAKLERLMRGQKELVAAVSHELRSPLARVKVSMEMAQDDALGGEARERHLRDVAGDLAELEALIDDLLLSSRLELADFPLRPEPVEMGALARELAGRYEGVEAHVAAEELLVTGDARLLRRLVGNLIENARKASSGPVRVEVRRDAGAVVADVADEGPGVPAGERERIFEPFHRLDPSRSRESGGAGLGLAIARRIALRHGGGLELVPTESGARFRLRLPALSAPQVQIK